MVATVLKCESETEAAFPVSDAEQTILSPAVSAASGLVVRKVIPRITLCRIIFADGCPLTLGEVWTPPFPVFLPGLIFLQALKFLVHKVVTPSTTIVATQRVSESSTFCPPRTEQKLELSLTP